jgi:hypothetical protein
MMRMNRFRTPPVGIEPATLLDNTEQPFLLIQIMVAI